jgi:16S rRNA (guanine1207-N2)-methyltransferase
MAGDHYFTAQPAAPAERRKLEVELAGHRLTVAVAGGVFSADRLDTGTRVLLREVPDPPADGALLDLGCGWGPITLALALRSPAATVYAVDVNERALGLTAANAAANGLSNVVAGRPEWVPSDVRFAAIWSNPPIRVGKAELHAMLRRWLPRLVAGGEAYLVVQKNLGADSLQRWVESDLGLPCSRYAVDKGFRVLQVTGPVTPAG